MSTNDPNINININAKNNAEKELEKAKQELDDIKSSATNAAQAFAALAGVEASAEFLKAASDAAERWIVLNAQIKNATSSQEEFNAAQQGVIDIANRTLTSLEATAVLFSKTNKALSGLGISKDISLPITELVQKLAGIEPNAASAADGVYQLTQALASNRAGGDEFRSIMENLPVLADQLAKGLKMSLGDLRELSKEGGLDTKTIVEALLKQSDEINTLFANMPVTISKSLQKMDNAWVEYIGRQNESVGVTKLVASSISGLADNMKTIGDAAEGFVLSLGFAGLAAGIGLIMRMSQAMSIATLETEANAVANQQAAAAEEARITALRLTIATQEQDIRTKIAATEASIAQTQADIASTQSMLLNATTMQTRAALVAQITTLNTQLAASTTLLAEQQAALNAVQTAGNLTWAKFLTLTNASSVALSVFAGFQLGDWARRNFAWMNVVQLRIEELIARFAYFTNADNFTLNPVKIYKSINDIEDKYNDLSKNVDKLSIEQRKEYEEQRKKEVEAVKKAEEEKQVVIREAFQKVQERLNAANEINKQYYERDIANLELAYQERAGVIESSIDAELQESDRRNNALFDSENDLNDRRLRATSAYYLSYLDHVKTAYDDEIAELKKRNLDTDTLQKESLNTQKRILQQLEQSYTQMIGKLTAEDEKHMQNALKSLQEINAIQERQRNRLRELDAIGLSETEKLENKRRALAEDTAKFKELVSQGEYARAVELGKKNEDLAFEIAKAQKEADKEGLQAIYDKEKLVQIQDELAVATEKSGESELKKFAEIKTEINAVKNALGQTGVRGEIDAINTEIAKIGKIKLDVDSQSLAEANKKINELGNIKVNISVGDISNFYPQIKQLITQALKDDLIHQKRSGQSLGG